MLGEAWFVIVRHSMALPASERPADDRRTCTGSAAAVGKPSRVRCTPMGVMAGYAAARTGRFRFNGLCAHVSRAPHVGLELEDVALEVGVPAAPL